LYAGDHGTCGVTVLYSLFDSAGSVGKGKTQKHSAVRTRDDRCFDLADLAHSENATSVFSKRSTDADA